jgi:hypothetical protein
MNWDQIEGKWKHLRVPPRSAEANSPMTIGRRSPARKISWSGGFRSDMNSPRRKPKSRLTRWSRAQKQASVRLTRLAACRIGG